MNPLPFLAVGVFQTLFPAGYPPSEECN